MRAAVDDDVGGFESSGQQSHHFSGLPQNSNHISSSGVVGSERWKCRRILSAHSVKYPVRGASRKKGSALSVDRPSGISFDETCHWAARADSTGGRYTLLSM